MPPPPQREFRGVWVASVANIDWPSKPGLPVEQQKSELLAIFDRCVQLKLNAVVLQVRPSCDALYDSKIEPWSEYLTGEMGKAPAPFYDPLTFAIAEAHKRGLELHAWFNPYRARHSGAKSPVSEYHISRLHPNLVKTYGKYLWLDPGEKAVQEHSLSVVLDMVKRYDVDGVHMDDYFYPYPEKDASGKNIDFPDEPSWQKYKSAGGKLVRDDWRRQNVNEFVQHVYSEVKRVKPWVKFGISPFGIWRPGNPPQIKGFDQYDQLYADARKWLSEGWVDYFAPQLYWKIDQPEQSYPVLLKWWTEQNPKGRHLWVGNYTSRVPEKWTMEEINDQIKATRKQPGATGNIHFSMKVLMPGKPYGDELLKGSYAQPALVPASPWLDNQPPGKPQASVKNGLIKWQFTGSEKVWQWVLQTQSGGKWTTQILPGDYSSQIFNGKAPDTVAITAVDRNGNASIPAIIEPNAPSNGQSK